jgi:NIMA (never in mitosis gene a)-related kinase
MKDYTIVKQLGEGGFAKTFHSVNSHDNSNYCIKEVPLRGISEKDFATIQSEAQILARLRHPNIVEYKTSFRGNDNFLSSPN